MSELDNQPQSISQYTLFEYEDKTYLIKTTEELGRLKVMNVEELPEEIRNYFLKLE
ncbi:hypothetical protein [Cytobacillus purgationiresistens]|uniref:Uncharacterized protein n=1 Tax=Cytobacillus purgationiresistens TaxID=863449 RepID=A0ABU0AJI2_9BACI|nr:hypothetical protein [Cytobacillus purgationiresistens]MDQ0271412.1 hypothetical protein [Cytobacillus purgationiresistens]